jgi:hypothetical protein
MIKKIGYRYAGFEVITVVTVKSTVFLGCNALWSSRHSQMLQRNVLPPFSGSEGKPSKKQVASRALCS